jgi:hypothetical protein
MDFKIKSDENRQIHINMDSINIYVARYVPNTEFCFKIVRKKKTISSPMRKYFYAVVLPLFCKAYGYDPEEMLTVHRHCKCTYFNVKPDSHGIYRDKDIPAVFGDESEKDIKEKNEYVEWMKRKASEAGVYIPDPGE